MKTWRFLRKLHMLFLLAALSVLLSSCGKGKTEAISGEGNYRIYYLDKTITGLSSVNYKASSTGCQELIGELMEQFLKVPNSVDAVAAPGDRVTYKGCTVDSNIVNVYFDENYSSMKPARTVLCNAALTKTLTQIKGVEHVAVYSGDQPLKDAKGTPVGPLSAADFVDSISNVNSYEKREFKLYFADESGTKLLEEKREVIYSMDTPLERVVVEQLIQGPQTEGMKATLQPDAKLLSVSVNDGVCYLNFSKAFLTAMQNEDSSLTVYSIVNSLSELTTVKKVQIAVEGSQKVMLGDKISLDSLFERNLDYLEESKTNR